MGKLQEILERRYGIVIRPEFTPKIFAITTDEQLILKDNPDRLSILLVNMGTEVCYVHTTREVSSALGIYLDKNGGGIEMPYEIYGYLIGQEWWCEGAGNTNLYVVPLVGV